MGAPVSIIGNRYGRLTIVEASAKQGGDSMWIASCDCGRTKIVSWRSLRNSLARGSRPSCGCVNREICEQNGKASATHRQTGWPEYAAWANMKDRCGNPSAVAFPHYGGRGIAVCAEWMESFETFFKDMGTKPSSEHSLHRIENSLGYSKSNCKWATPLEQASNRRRSSWGSHVPSILALDLAKVTGFAHGPINEMPQTGSIKFGRGGSSLAATLAECRRWLAMFLADNPTIEMVVFESPLVPSMVRGKTTMATIRQLICLPGIVEELLFTLGGYDVREARVADIRTHFLGSNRFKRDMAKALTLTKCRQLGWTVANHDAADAAALWHYQASILEPHLALQTNPLFRRGL